MSQNKQGNPYFSASSLLFVARIAGAAAMFGVQIVLARTTSPDTLALYFLATSLVTVAGTVAALGYPYVVIAFMARYHRPRHAEIERAFLAAARSDILMASAIIALGLGAAVALYPHLNFSERLSFLIALPAIPAIALSRSNGAIGRARSRLA